MREFISVGTVSIDLYYKGGSLTHTNNRFELAIGGKYFVDAFHEGVGGGGSNVAMGVASHGIESGLIARIGDNPFKDIILRKLDDRGVRYAGMCHLEKNYWNISTVLLNSDGERTIVNYRSPHQHIFDNKDERKRIIGAKALFLASLSSVSLTERIELLSFAKAHDIQTFANLNVTDCRRHVEELRHFLQFVDVLVINTHECADIVKTSCESIDFETDITADFAPFYKDLLLVVTDGKKGSYAYHDHHVHTIPSHKDVKVVDATGAGDGYTAGFIASYMRKKDIAAAMKAGSEYAVTILEKLGAN